MYHYNMWFCTCDSHIPIKNGRWGNIPRNERICKWIGNEFHYILHSTSLQQKSTIFIDKAYIKTTVYSVNQTMSNDKQCFKKEICMKINKMCPHILISILHICTRGCQKVRKLVWWSKYCLCYAYQFYR